MTYCTFAGIVRTSTKHPLTFSGAIENGNYCVIDLYPKYTSFSAYSI